MTIDAKPLSQETRAEIVQHGHEYDPHPPFWSFIQELLAAEQYWREAVKNTNNAHWETNQCPFCDQDDLPHKPDCPWRLAQE